MRRFVLLLVIAFAAPALAQMPAPSDTLMRDYIGLTKALRASGVDPVLVNWPYIEGMCLGLKQERNHIPYNRCRFEKAIDSNDYPADVTVCEQRAQLAYIEAVHAANPAPNVIGGVIYPTTSYPIIVNSYTTQFNDIRSSTFGDCMRERGWINPSSAGRGRLWNYQ